MGFIDEVEDLEAKARLRKAAPVAAVGIVALVLAAVLLVLHGAFGGVGLTISPEGEASVSSSGSATSSTASTANSGSSASESAAQAVVYVTGAVQNPGVYALPASARVDDAVKAAGGLTDQAAPAALNLARTVTDGEQIQVPTQAEAAAQATAGGAVETEAGGTAAFASSAFFGKVNINTAGLEELKTLKGVGDATAQKIIDYRTANGPFATIEDLKQVAGIGEKRFAAIADKICV